MKILIQYGYAGLSERTIKVVAVDTVEELETQLQEYPIAQYRDMEYEKILPEMGETLYLGNSHSADLMVTRIEDDAITFPETLVDHSWSYCKGDFSISQRIVVGRNLLVMLPRNGRSTTNFYPAEGPEYHLLRGYDAPIPTIGRVISTNWVQDKVFAPWTEVVVELLDGSTATMIV